jgi:hypothetical protein
MGKWYSVTEAAKKLKLSSQAVRHRAERGTIRSRAKKVKYILEVFVKD